MLARSVTSSSPGRICRLPGAQSPGCAASPAGWPVDVRAEPQNTSVRVRTSPPLCRPAYLQAAVRGGSPPGSRLAPMSSSAGSPSGSGSNRRQLGRRCGRCWAPWSGRWSGWRCPAADAARFRRAHGLRGRLCPQAGSACLPAGTGDGPEPTSSIRICDASGSPLVPGHGEGGASFGNPRPSLSGLQQITS